jgi:ubiquitin C-terminal hydrolase
MRCKYFLVLTKSFGTVHDFRDRSAKLIQQIRFEETAGHLIDRNSSRINCDSYEMICSFLAVYRGDQASGCKSHELG